MKIYKLTLSNKESLLIDEIELQKFENNVDKNFIKLKNGIINPSFVVSITLDKESTYEVNKEITFKNKPLEIAGDTQKIDIMKFKPAFLQ